MSAGSGRKPRIYDAVYGYVELDDAEFRLVNTAIFQRLHWIKQLGPLHIVFPSAQHSRFSHSIGVFYIAKKMIEHLQRLDQGNSKYGYTFDENEDRILKFAALLHDIGHVPLSHIGECVLRHSVDANTNQEHEEQQAATGLDLLTTGVRPSGEAWQQLFNEGGYYCTRTKLHESLSAEIVVHDEEIDKVLSMVWHTKSTREEFKRRIAQTIVGQDLSDIPTVLLHSELDADRLDYLLRDSFFTGVGYGQVDLDYIISRLVIFRKSEDDHGDLCVEHKGFHTVEHYILGRFFLQTQVIYNRKVRCLDLLFEDVMGYMLRKNAPKEHRLMNLSEFVDCIRAAKGAKKREYLHQIYSYTDAEVFTKMRALHEYLDDREKAETASDEELYINDCIKTIMDGGVRDPAFHTCHMLVDRRKMKGYEDDLEREANEIAKDVAARLNIYRPRIKISFRSQEVMKYRRTLATVDDNGTHNNMSVTSGMGGEPNAEAVRIILQTPRGEDKQMFAGESNATILRDLSDKALLQFNCYYVQSKKAEASDIQAVEAKIAIAFADYRERRFGQTQNGLQND